MYQIEFTIPGLPKTFNALNRKHWSIKAAEAKNWKMLVVFHVGRNKPKAPLMKAKVTLTRYSCAEIDGDGLTSSFKHVLDGLTLAGVIYDDKMSIIGMPTYIHEKAKRKDGRISVKVEELLESEKP